MTIEEYIDDIAPDKKDAFAKLMHVVDANIQPVSKKKYNMACLPTLFQNPVTPMATTAIQIFRFPFSPSQRKSNTSRSITWEFSATKPF